MSVKLHEIAPGIPHHSHGARHVEAALGAAHDAHMEELNNGGWPCPKAYKKTMLEAKDKAAAQWHSMQAAITAQIPVQVPKTHPKHRP